MDTANSSFSVPQFDESSFYKNQLSKSPVVATCEICKKQFKSIWGYRCHMKFHDISVGKLDKCFKCMICSKFYPTNAQLRQHMRCHSQERPFVCNKCGRSYKHNCHLKMHVCTFSINK